METTLASRKKLTVIETCECEFWILNNPHAGVKNIQETFPYSCSYAEYQLLEEIYSEKLFGYDQCIIEVPEKLRQHVANFPLLFKDTSGQLHRYWEVDDTV